MFPSLPSVSKLLYGFRGEGSLFPLDAFASEIIPGESGGGVSAARGGRRFDAQRIAFLRTTCRRRRFCAPGGGRTVHRWFTPTWRWTCAGSRHPRGGACTGDRGAVPCTDTFPLLRQRTLGVSVEGDRLCSIFPARPGEPVAAVGELAAAQVAAPSEALQAQDLSLLAFMSGAADVGGLATRHGGAGRAGCSRSDRDRARGWLRLRFALFCPRMRDSRGPGDRFVSLHSRALLGSPVGEKLSCLQGRFLLAERALVRADGRSCKNRRALHYVSARRNFILES